MSSDMEERMQTQIEGAQIAYAEYRKKFEEKAIAAAINAGFDNGILNVEGTEAIFDSDGQIITDAIFYVYREAYFHAFKESLAICARVAGKAERLMENEKPNYNYYEAKRNGATHCETEIRKELVNAGKVME